MKFTKDQNKKKEIEYDSNNKKTRKRTGMKVFKIFFISILVIGFAAGGSMLGAVVAIINTAPSIDDISISPDQHTTILYDQNGNEVRKITGGENRISVELDQIPKHMQQSVICVEDERFYSHFGIDIKGMLRAFVANVKELDYAEGASTITQQLLKNRSADLTFEKLLKRKIQEQYLAVVLEKKLSDEHGKKKAKDIILLNYLNTMHLGHGAYGVQTAAQRYFNKDVWELSLAESAAIAGITQNSITYSPVLHPDNNKKKQHIILNKMLEQEYITENEYNAAIAEDVYSKVQKSPQKNMSNSTNSYFVDAVIEDVAKDLIEKKGITENEALNIIYQGGLSIYITQDSKMQKIMDEEFLNDENFPPQNIDYKIKLDYAITLEHKDETRKNYYPKGEKIFKTREAAEQFVKEYKASIIKPTDKVIAEKNILIPQPQAAMVIMDYTNGYVKALTGGRGEKSGNRVFNRATSSQRHPGSTFKVLAAFAPAIDACGYTAATIMDDVPFEINVKGSPTYKPSNWYDDNSHEYGYRGLSTIRDGITDSMNILAVKTLYDIGIPTAFDYLLNFGFTTLVEDKETKDGRIVSDKVYSLALGGLTRGVTPIELTAAYAAIANKGVYTEPILYTKVLDHEGNVIIDKKPETHTVLKETTAFLLTDMMKDVVTVGTGKLADIKDMPVAGKTGTSSKDVDLTFAGYTPYYASAIWMGHDEQKALTYKTSYHNKLWSKIMSRVHEDLDYKDFEVPEGLVQRKICKESGKLAVEGVCDNDPRGSKIITEWFVKGTEPTEICDVHIKQKKCKVSGLYANDYCPPDQIEEVIHIKRPDDMKLPYDKLDQKTLERIEDYHLELPPSMEGEYCNEHGPHSLSKSANNFFIDFNYGGRHNNNSRNNRYDDIPDSNDNQVSEPPVSDDKDSLDDFFDLNPNQ